MALLCVKCASSARIRVRIMRAQAGEDRRMVAFGPRHLPGVVGAQGISANQLRLPQQLLVLLRNECATAGCYKQHAHIMVVPPGLAQVLGGPLVAASGIQGDAGGDTRQHRVIHLPVATPTEIARCSIINRAS